MPSYAKYSKVNEFSLQQIEEGGFFKQKKAGGSNPPAV
jgi:hypothetical protein